MVTFKDFATTLSVELHKRYEGIELDTTGLDIELPEYRLVGGCNTGNNIYTGIFIIKGDGLDILQIKKQMETISLLLKDKKMPENFLNIYIFYVYEKGCPGELKGRNFNDKDFPGTENLEFKISRVFYAASVDLLEPSLISTQYGGVFLEALKSSVINVKTGWVPSENYIEEYKNRYYDFKLRLEQNKPYGTYLIFFVCIAMFLWTTVSGGSTGLYTLLRFGANYGPLVKSGEWWRLTGSMFLHIGAIHLLVNMFTLLSIGSTLEKYFGTPRYMALYALAGIGGSLASAFIRHIVAAGASGAIFGLCGAAAYLGYRYSTEIPARLRKQLAGGMVSCIGYNLLYGFMSSGIDNSAHIGGLIVGVIYAILISPPVIKEKNKEGASIYSLLFLIIAIIPFITQSYIAYRAVYKTGVENYPVCEYRDEHNRDVLFKYPALLSVKEYNKEKILAGPGIMIQVRSFDMEDIAQLRAGVRDVLSGLEKNGFKIKEHKFITVNNREWLFVDTDMDRNVKGYLLFTGSGKKVFRLDIGMADSFITPGKEIMDYVMKNFLPGKT
ncbi:MAG: rhomboid family intramembrane serine protease [Candidatus Eremiobacterota bacterium]